jgi:hypothetical protein
VIPVYAVAALGEAFSTPFSTLLLKTFHARTGKNSRVHVKILTSHFLAAPFARLQIFLAAFDRAHGGC